MPLIQVKFLKGTFTPAQKREIIAKLSEVVVMVKAEDLRMETWVSLEDAGGGEWSVSGQAELNNAEQSLISKQKEAVA
jgi:4-oxalocrotonate tautomerase